MVTINLHSTQVKRMHTKAVGTIFAFKNVTQRFNSNCSTSHGQAKSTVGGANNEPWITKFVLYNLFFQKPGNKR